MDAHTHTLRRFTFTAVLLVFFTVLLTACLGNDTSSTVEGNSCYISNVAFSYLRVPHVVTKTVTLASGIDSTYDSTYYTSYLASGYKFVVDQIHNKIYNRDSIPAGTDLSKVPLTISYTGGYVKWQDAWSEPDEWETYSSSDSLDLTSQLKLQVVATDLSSRTYTLDVNMHGANGDTLLWAKVDSDREDFRNYPMQAFHLQDNEPAVLVDKNGTVHMYILDSDKKFSEVGATFPSGANIRTICSNGYNCYISTEEGKVYQMQDDPVNITWENLNISNDGNLRLVGTSDTCLYAIRHTDSGTTILYCNLADEPLEFRVDNLDDDASALPTDSILWESYYQNISECRLLMMGAVGDGTHSTWTKSWTTDMFDNKVHVENEVDEAWMKYDRSWDDVERLPNMKELQMMGYNDHLIAFGGPTYDNTHSALDVVYSSYDNGMSWRKDLTMPFPVGISSAYSDHLSSVESNGVLWLFTGGNVYRGTLGRLAYKRQDLEQ